MESNQEQGQRGSPKPQHMKAPHGGHSWFLCMRFPEVWKNGFSQLGLKNVLSVSSCYTQSSVTTEREHPARTVHRPYVQELT